MERICFNIPCEFALGINATNEIEAWAKLREWFNNHSMYYVQDGERIKLPDRSMIEASVIVKDGDEIKPGVIGLEIKCHRVKVIGRSVPPDNSSMWDGGV